MISKNELEVLNDFLLDWLWNILLDVGGEGSLGNLDDNKLRVFATVLSEGILSYLNFLLSLLLLELFLSLSLLENVSIELVGGESKSTEKNEVE